ncbi:MAG: bifunctional diaminohydroxyphosphoribosylaminopyrimidine deaminase/5-amino-6-(5-phosphoribosylamino)uracil reductase RibD [Planctomycetota bacterium]
MPADPDLDARWMRRALDLAERGRGRVEPNPVVGCVFVDPKLGVVLGEGYHGFFGGPHAEVMALRDAARRGNSVGQATAYVTLEPCSHFGKTPPCANALVEAGVARVVAALQDPFEEVAGKGFERLRNAGVEVTTGVLEAEARRAVAAYLMRIEHQRPLVTVKWAATVDGRTAARTGDSKWITGEASRKRVHELRARFDAVMVGVGTVLADDPRLTARDVEVLRLAKRIVIDRDLHTPAHAKLLRDPASDPAPGPDVWIACAQEAIDSCPDAAQALRNAGAELVPLPADNQGRLGLAPLLRKLHDAAGSNVLVEGGASLNASLFEQGLADRVVSFTAPSSLIDRQATPALAGQTPVESIAQGGKLRLHHAQRLPREDGQEDVLLEYDVLR